MTDEALNERRAADDEWQRQKAAEGPPLENAGSEPESEYERFEDLARKLVNTPKRDPAS
jgi:hypothetical protein